MRALALALVLASAAALGQAQHTSFNTFSKVFPSKQTERVVATFFPADGTGLASVAELCTAASAELTGSYFCLKSDGTAASGSAALTARGTPTSESFTTCPNSTNCTAAPGQKLNGSSQYFDSAAVAAPTGDFSICILYSGASTTTTAYALIDKMGAASNNSVRFESSGGGGLFVNVYKTDGTASSVTSDGISNYTRTLACAVYDFVTDGTSDLRIYVDGAVSGIPVTTAVGPAQATATIPWEIGRRGFGGGSLHLLGRVHGAFITEKVISAGTMATIARAVLADAPTGASGEAVTFTRASTRFCTNEADSAGSWLPIGRPCVTTSGTAVGIEYEGARTNRVIRNTELDHAAWTHTNVTVPTADTQLAPDSTTTAEVLTSTVNGGFSESTASTAWAGVDGSVYVRTTAGTQAAAIRIRNTTAGSDVCTGTITATTTWQRLFCEGLTTAADDHTLRIYPGGTGGTGTVVAWGAQLQEVNDTSGRPNSVILTAGTAVARSPEIATVAIPASVTNAKGCLAFTFGKWKGYSSAVPFLADTSQGNLLGGISPTLMTGDDGVTTFSRTVASIRTNNIRTRIQWSGSTINIEATGGSGGTPTVAYDGTLIGDATLTLGGVSTNTSNANIVISNVQIGTGPGGCPL